MSKPIIVTFAQSKLAFEYGEVEVNWYNNNFGHWFIKASDIAKLLAIPSRQAQAVYKDTLPDELQTGYLNRELCGSYLQALNELTEGASQKLWTSIRTEFHEDTPSKFNLPILAYKLGKKLVTAIDLTELDNLANVARLQTGVDLAEYTFGKSTRTVSTTQYLVVNDSQVQLMINAINEKELNKAQYKRVLEKAKKAKLEKIKPAKAETADPRLVKLQEQLASVHASKPQAIKQATLDKLKQQEVNIRKSVANITAEHYVSLYAQSELLKEASAAVGEIYGEWNHRAFIDLFDNTRILNVLSETMKQVKDMDTDLFAVIGLIDDNINKLRKGARQIIEVARQHQAMAVKHDRAA